MTLSPVVDKAYTVPGLAICHTDDDAADKIDESKSGIIAALNHFYAVRW